MPKKRKRGSSKKLLDKDFKKVKEKVGKKQKAANATSTAFQTKNVVLPVQSALRDKTGEIVTTRKLTLQDLIGKLKHYNENVRKDAVMGMKEILTEHPEILASSLTAVISSIVVLLHDSGGDVRKSLVTMLTAVFPLTNPSDISPHFPLIMMHLSSAITHVTSGIRESSVEVLYLIIQNFPLLIRANRTKWLPILPPLISQAHLKGTSTSFRNKTLKILQEFLYCSNREIKNEDNSEIQKLDTVSEYSILRPSHNSFDLVGKLTIDPTLASNIGRNAEEKEWNDLLVNARETLSPIIIQLLMECTPSDSATSTANVEHMELLLNCLLGLRPYCKEFYASTTVQHGGSNAKLLKTVYPLFPLSFTLSDSAKQHVVSQKQMHVNILLALLLHPHLQSEHKKKGIDSDNNGSDEVSEFVINSLQNGERGAYNLLPIVSRIAFHNSSKCLRHSMMRAFSTFFIGCGTLSTSKEQCLGIIHRILEDNTDSNQLAVKELEKCILHMPKLLWQLNTSNLKLTQKVINILRLLGEKTLIPERAAMFDATQRSLVPFFAVEVAKQQKSVVYGPFLQLPLNLKQSVIDLLFWYKSLLPSLTVGLLLCCTSDLQGIDDVQKAVCNLLEIRAFHNRLQQRIDPKEVNHFVSFLLSLFIQTENDPIHQFILRKFSSLSEQIKQECLIPGLAHIKDTIAVQKISAIL